MYSENRTRDAVLFARACVTNLLARTAPALYVRLTGQTGRGSDDGDAASLADYYWRCFYDYGQQLGLTEQAYGAFLVGRRVLEYGPGDILGVALLFHAHGASVVECVDRFPLERVSNFNAAVYRALVDRLPHAQRERAAAAFTRSGDPTSGLRAEAVRYRVTPDGLAARPEAFDLVVSRAVLEHVNSLEATLSDIACAMAPGGVAVHNVDLRSHNLDRDRPYDFLTWSEPLYRLMYSHKGFPNRWRSDAYRAILERTGLVVRSMEPTGRLAAADVERIRDRVAAPLRGASDDELSWLGFWMVLEKLV